MLNQIIIFGYLGHDPELTERQGQNGPYKQVKISVGVGRDFGDETDWFNCTMSGKRAEVIEKYFKKGDPILVIGRMESYKSKDSNLKGWSLRMNDFQFVTSGKGKTEDAPRVKPPVEDSFTEITEDLPF